MATSLAGSNGDRQGLSAGTYALLGVGLGVVAAVVLVSRSTAPPAPPPTAPPPTTIPPPTVPPPVIIPVPPPPVVIVPPAAPPPPPGTAWSGSFDSFPTATWAGRWGALSQAAWGLSFPRTAIDPGALEGPALTVPYAAHSSAPSCTTCPDPRGAQFYTDLSKIGLASLQTAASLRLRYKVRFPVTFDWSRGGKLPGLYGGDVSASSGGTHGAGWSTRLMWRHGPAGEVYFYSPTATGYGADLGLASWSFDADGHWHTYEQLVERSPQRVTMWKDNAQVFQGGVPGTSGIPFAGIFFSTFFGGHDSTWGPAHDTSADFADFSLSAG